MNIISSVPALLAARREPRAEPTDVIRKLQRLGKERRLDKGVDLVLEVLDAWMDAGNWKAVDDLLWEADVETLHEDHVVALLMATYPARRTLTERAGLLARYEAKLAREGRHDADRTLQHLR
jgi:hypothetical protein